MKKLLILIIGPSEKAEAKRVREFAEANPIPLEELARQTPLGAIPGYCLRLELGFKIVYTIENQPLGKCRHLSIRLDSKTNYPSPESINEILELFEFTCRVAVPPQKSTENPGFYVFLTESQRAINILEVVMATA